MTTTREIKAEIAANTKSLQSRGDSNAHNTAQSMANKTYGASWRTQYAPAGTSNPHGNRAGGTRRSSSY